MSGGHEHRSRDGWLYDVAERQAGYFTMAQAREACFKHSQLTYYVRARRFIRVRWGVYRLVRYPSTPYEDLIVAWLEAGPEAVIFHDSALALYELSDALPDRKHVTVPRSASRRRPGLALHTNRLDPPDVTTVAGLPVTTVPRTIADVAASGLAEEQISLAVRQALERGLVSELDLELYASTRGGRPQRLISEALQEQSPGDTQVAPPSVEPWKTD
jgi:predicted transcriptional regulator of viral defense system